MPKRPPEEPAQEDQEGSPAENAYREFRAQHPSPTDDEFDGLCKRHPGFESALRRLHAQFRTLDTAQAHALLDYCSPESADVTPDSNVFRPSTGKIEEPCPQETLIPQVGPGSVVGDFRTVSLLGTGGMGQVWLAEQISLRRRVALKLVRPDRVSPYSLELFAREARAGGRLHHPGIVTIHASGESSGFSWIAMEYVEGSWTLRDAIDELIPTQSVPAGYDRQAARIAAEIADAVQAGHDAGVLHRDLKPQNILIQSDGRPRITDFGLAKLTDETAVSQSGDIAGTYLYMSPEQVAAKRMGLDHRTDVFSLGVILYEMLTLRRPFQGDTTHQIAAQILTKDPPDPRTIRSQIPRDLVVITGKALEKDPDRRYLSMTAFADDLRRYIADRPIVARPPTPGERLAKWARRNPTKSISGAVAALAFVAVSVLLAANVRANRELAEQKAAAEARTNEVLRLSALQDLEDLISAADDPTQMWPPHPNRIDAYLDWTERAQALIGELPEYIRIRNELRALALPTTPEWRRRERESHPRHQELLALEGKIVSLRRALAQRREGTEPELPDVASNEYPDTPERLLALAAPLVAPTREKYGQEAEGLALAYRALELAGADSDLRPEIHSILANAALSLGRDDEALNSAFDAFDFATPDEKEAYGLRLAELESAIEEAASPAGLAAAESRISALEQEYAELNALVAQRRIWRFPEKHSEARWWDSQLTKLISGLEALRDENTGLLGAAACSRQHGWSVPRRLDRAKQLEAAFSPGEPFDVRWKAVLPKIGRAYQGLELQIQMGLVPIGPDSRSKLWEFWVVHSGDEPARGDDGSLQINEQSGLVMVLLPGGYSHIGAQSVQPGAPNYDPDASPTESPVHEVDLSPFFISKYEMTQGQWMRLTGQNPSRWFPGSDLSGVTLQHPVETITWDQARRVLAWIGLQMPSEAQWEYACRAGSGSAFSCAFNELATHANLADRAYKRAFTTRLETEDWNDGYGGHAPVGLFLPNGFGLHDVHGNVWEWCLDGFDGGSYSLYTGRDPIAPHEGSAVRLLRGGCYYDPAVLARSARRNNDTPSNAAANVGIRPARNVTE